MRVKALRGGKRGGHGDSGVSVDKGGVGKRRVDTNHLSSTSSN